MGLAMAVKRLPTQFPTLIAKEFESFEDGSLALQQLSRGIEELRRQLINTINDHSDVLDGLQLPLHTDANRGAASTAGRLIFNTDDGRLNIDDGTNWTLPDGTTT